MPKFLLKPITPKRLHLIDVGRIESELRAELNGDFKPVVKAAFESTVSTWTHKPDFDIRTFVGPEIKMTAAPTGPYADIWNFVSGGTRPHLIYPRRAGALRFQTGYRAKTRPGRIRAGSGGASGPWAAARFVRHPGTEPRDFPQAIADEVYPEFRRISENAIRRAVR